MILGMLVSVAVPLLFLTLVRWLDLYASGSFRAVLICPGGGAVAFLLALPIDGAVAGAVGYTLAVTLAAPVVEEITSAPSCRPRPSRCGCGWARRWRRARRHSGPA